MWTGGKTPLVRGSITPGDYAGAALAFLACTTVTPDGGTDGAIETDGALPARPRGQAREEGVLDHARAPFQ